MLRVPFRSVAMWLLLALSILCGAGACVGRRASISNQLPRRDTQGRILDAHDGSLVQHHAGGRFYLYGTSYGPNCTITPNPCSLTYGSCGWRNNNFSAYSTADFQTWTREAESLIPVDQRPDGIYFRPKVSACCTPRPLCPTNTSRSDRIF